MPLLRERVKVVLMAGGRGERFWPRSTRNLPKQFLRVDADKSLLRRTFDRAASLVSPQAIYVVTGHEYAHLTRKELPELPQENLICEPVGRNTAPALGLAALWLERTDPGSILIAMPSDHHVTGQVKFQATLMAAVEAAREGYLVTLGVQPTRPETGYGYIQSGESLELQAEIPIHRVARFVEKPDRVTAESFLASGDYLWNSGVVVCQSAELLCEIAHHLPQVEKVLGEIDATSRSLADLTLQVQARFGEMPSISIDHGVLERSDRVVVVPACFGWNDVGDWASLGRLLPQDEHGNTVQGDTLLHESRGLVVHAGADRLVVAIGLNDLIIVDTPRVVLVCNRELAQEVRQVARLGAWLVDALEQAQLPEGTVVQKPWGREIRWAVTAHYGAKLLEVKAGHAQTLQSHDRKHETLYCQSGSGRLHMGEIWHDVRPGTVFDLAPGTVHQLEAHTDLRLIAVSTPELDDLIRLEDSCGRSGAV